MTDALDKAFAHADRMVRNCKSAALSVSNVVSASAGYNNRPLSLVLSREQLLHFRGCVWSAVRLVSQRIAGQRISALVPKVSLGTRLLEALLREMSHRDEGREADLPNVRGQAELPNEGMSPSPGGTTDGSPRFQPGVAVTHRTKPRMGRQTHAPRRPN